MLINNWYVAARTHEIGETPFKSRMLGLDFVLFRALRVPITAGNLTVAALAPKFQPWAMRSRSPSALGSIRTPCRKRWA